MLFVGGILTYFVLASEPDTGLAVALVLATVGLCLTLRGVPLGQALGFAVLAFARRRHCLPLRPARLYRHGQRQKGGADPPSAALEEDCRRAHIVIAPFTVGKKCRAARVIVDRRMLRAYGAHALYIDGLSIRTVTVAAARGLRPWVLERDIIAPIIPYRLRARPMRVRQMKKTTPRSVSTAIRSSESSLSTCG